MFVVAAKLKKIFLLIEICTEKSTLRTSKHVASGHAYEEKWLRELYRAIVTHKLLANR